MNAVTHGLGVILSIIGGYVMSERVKEQSIAHKISCSIYTTSLLTLYLSSTLYHSFFPLQHIKYIFQVMDKCAIYVLIAGSYTPILTVIFHDNMVFSFGLLGFIWTCCLLGISVEAFAPTWNWRPIFSLAMYLGMGCLSRASRRGQTTPRSLYSFASFGRIRLHFGRSVLCSRQQFGPRTVAPICAQWECFPLAGYLLVRGERPLGIGTW